MINALIKDGSGNNFFAKVTSKQALLVSQGNAEPSFGDHQNIRPFRQYLTDDGSPEGNHDLRSDGSTNFIDYYINANSENDTYISCLSFVIADASASLNKFGNISPLTNGCQCLYTSNEIGDIIFHEKISTNFDLIRFCLGNPILAGSTPSNAWLIGNAISASEAYMAIFDISKIMPPFGLQLYHGSTEKLIFRIRDDIRGIDNFDCIAYGFEILPDK